MPFRIDVPQTVIPHIAILIQRLGVADIRIRQRPGFEDGLTIQIVEAALSFIRAHKPLNAQRVISRTEEVETRLRIAFLAGKALADAVRLSQLRIARRHSAWNLILKRQVIMPGNYITARIRDHPQAAQMGATEVARRAGRSGDAGTVLSRQIPHCVVHIHDRLPELRLLLR